MGQDDVLAERAVTDQVDLEVVETRTTVAKVAVPLEMTTKKQKWSSPLARTESQVKQHLTQLRSMSLVT